MVQDKFSFKRGERRFLWRPNANQTFNVTMKQRYWPKTSDIFSSIFGKESLKIFRGSLSFVPEATDKNQELDFQINEGKLVQFWVSSDLRFHMTLKLKDFKKVYSKTNSISLKNSQNHFIIGCRYFSSDCPGRFEILAMAKELHYSSSNWSTGLHNVAVNIQESALPEYSTLSTKFLIGSVELKKDAGGLIFRQLSSSATIGNFTNTSQDDATTDKDKILKMKDAILVNLKSLNAFGEDGEIEASMFFKMAKKKFWGSVLTPQLFLNKKNSSLKLNLKMPDNEFNALAKILLPSYNLNGEGSKMITKLSVIEKLEDKYSVDFQSKKYSEANKKNDLSVLASIIGPRPKVSSELRTPAETDSHLPQ